MFPKVISYYTENTAYEEEAKGLIESCKKHEIEYEIESIPNLGSWEENCCYKPKFIEEKLKATKNPILWLDADAVVYRKPKLFERLDADLAIHINPSLPLTHPSKVSSGTIFINPTKKSFKVLCEWKKEAKKMLADNPSHWDQISLRNVIQKVEANIKPLDKSYYAIYTKIESQQELEQSYFIHFQASRTLKKTINNEVVPFWDEKAHIKHKKDAFFSKKPLK